MSRTTLLAAALAVAVPASSLAQAPATLRLDYFHTASADEERYALDAVVEEGTWPGNPDRPLDGLNLGKYRFEVVDRATQRTLYSRGFASICGEWETTGAPATSTGPSTSRSASRSRRGRYRWW